VAVLTVNTLWYVGRGSGLVDLVLLTLVLVLGIANRSGRAIAGLPRFAVAVLHRNTSLLAVAFLVLHVVTLWLDPFAELHFYDLVAPFAAGYRPLWTGLGTVAFDLMLALVITSLLRQRMSLGSWRLIHWTAYAAWPFAIAHTLGTGTDALSVWLLATTIVCIVAVGATVVWRFSPEFTETGPARQPVGVGRHSVDGPR
jgi:sulfoxide reductase heme-binding subunit YedZ